MTQTGQPVASFGQDGIVQFATPVALPNGSIRVLNRIAVESDGSVLLAGNISATVGGSSSNAMFFLIKLNPDGSLDTGFGTGGEVTGGFTAGDDTLSAIVVESDDSILIGATLDTANDASSTAALIHIEPDGSLDIGFGTGGVLDLPSVAGRLQRDGPAAGREAAVRRHGEEVNTATAAKSSALDTDENPDPTFGTDGIAAFGYPDFIYDAIVQPDGKILDRWEQRSHGNGHAA